MLVNGICKWNRCRHDRLVIREGMVSFWGLERHYISHSWIPCAACRVSWFHRFGHPPLVRNCSQLFETPSSRHPLSWWLSPARYYVRYYVRYTEIKSDPLECSYVMVSDQLIVRIAHRSPIARHKVIKDFKSPGGALVLHVFHRDTLILKRAEN